VRNHANYSIFSWFSVSGLIAHQVSEDRRSSSAPEADEAGDLPFSSATSFAWAIDREQDGRCLVAIL
jgi:hypothetical protein